MPFREFVSSRVDHFLLLNRYRREVQKRHRRTVGTFFVMFWESPVSTKSRGIGERLEQPISSATAEEGRHVELCVTDAVKIGDALLIAAGAHGTSTITQAHEKRRIRCAGKLNFSIDRVKVVDNQWIPLRYTVTRKSDKVTHSVPAF